MSAKASSIRISTFLTAFLLLIVTDSFSAQKAGRIERVSNATSAELRAGYMFSSADTCQVRHDAGLYWRIDGWVIGNELYKSYLDPAASCNLPYPYTIEEINMPMAFDAATPLIVSVDIEAVDNTDPNCPAPGALLAISAQYQFDVPGPGLYDVWVPLDSPITVNGPFFAGFFIGNLFDAEVNPAVITDSIPVSCVSYNIWDTTIGYADLTDNDFFNFPGRLVLYASGYTGGSGGENPDPSVKIISPRVNEILYGYTTIWAWEKSGSDAIDYVKFEVKPDGGSYSEIGRDFDGTQTLRDGVNPAVASDGFSYFWDFSTRTEGYYFIKATAVDTAGNIAADSFRVFLEPTPPVPDIVSPADADIFCSEVELLFNLYDEDFLKVEAYIKPGDSFFTLGLPPLNQADFGDANGNPSDGNSSSNGEYGTHYSGPIVATQAMRVWYDRGYSQLMKNGSADIPLNDFVELMAVEFKTRQNRGTYEEDFYGGLLNHLSGFNIIKLDHMRNPAYFDLRKWLQEEERAVMLGLGGNPGLWVALDGFSGWQNQLGQFAVRIANPVSGNIETSMLRENSGVSEIQISGSWHSIDVMFSLNVITWTVTRQLIGVDLDATNGLSIKWTPTDLTDQDSYFFTGVGYDFSGYVGNSSVVLKNDCASFFVPGDYDGDSNANLMDLVLLIDFVAQSGPAPVGGAGRADANCDNIINITDVVYYMNYMFGSASDPCY